MFSARITKSLAAFSVMLILATACGSSVPPTVPAVGPGGTAAPRTATPVPATDEEAIRQLINAECESLVQQDSDRLQGLWLDNGVITDAMHTKDNTGDDSTWKGWTAIRDRYINIVFPSNPTFCEHPDIQVSINGNSATASSSVKIGTTNCQNCNEWAFTKDGANWRIASLTYNLSPQ